MIIYGSMLCGDCVSCREELDKAGIAYEYRDFSDNLQNLKDFLKLRDQDPVFLKTKKEGCIGIPCILKDDGKVVLDWKEFI